MNWTVLSSTSELVSSVAVLVTLIYLAIQTRQNAGAIRANTRQAILASDQQLITLVSNDPELEVIRFKPQLSDQEKIRLGFFLLTFIRMRESNWLQYQNDVLDEVTWRTYRGSIVVMLGNPNGRKWWQNYRSVPDMFDSAFISLVDELLANAPTQQKSRMLKAFD